MFVDLCVMFPSRGRRKRSRAQLWPATGPKPTKTKIFILASLYIYELVSVYKSVQSAGRGQLVSAGSELEIVDLWGVLAGRSPFHSRINPCSKIDQRFADFWGPVGQIDLPAGGALRTPTGREVNLVPRPGAAGTPLKSTKLMSISK